MKRLLYFIPFFIFLIISHILSQKSSNPFKSNYTKSYEDNPKPMNVDSIFSFIRQDTTWGADYYRFTKRDSCMWVFVSPKFDYTDSALLTHKIYQIAYLYNIERSTNISGLAIMKTQKKNSKKSPEFIYGWYKPNSICENEFKFLILAAERQ